MGFMGTPVYTHKRIVNLFNYRRVHFGLAKGSSDLIGFKTRTITKKDVGKRIAQFVAIEVKASKGRIKESQKNFIDVVNKFGGMAGIARSNEDAEGIINQ